MTNLMTISSKISMTSREIAEITGKRHADVLRDIKVLQEQVCNERTFGLVEYKDAKGEMRPEYVLDKDECLLLATGYNAILRLQLINRWKELEAAHTVLDWSDPRNMRLALDAHIETLEKLEAATKQLHLQAPKVKIAEEMYDFSGTMSTGDVAKSYGLSAQKLNIILERNGIVRKDEKHNTWCVPTARLKKFPIKQFSYVNGRYVGFAWHFTEVARQNIHLLLTNLGYSYGQENLNFDVAVC